MKYFRFTDPGYKLHRPKARCSNIVGGHNALIAIEEDVYGSASPGLDEKFKGCKKKCNEIEECRFFAIRLTKNDCELFRSCNEFVDQGGKNSLTFSKRIKGTEYIIRYL